MGRTSVEATGEAGRTGRWMRRLAAAALACGLVAGAAAAQDRPADGGALGRALGFEGADPAGSIGTGRPSFSTGPGTVPLGYLQIEGGYSFAEAGDVETRVAPLLVLRAGVGERVELRLGWSGFISTDSGAGGDTAANDLVLGVKTTLRASDDGPTAIGLLAQVSLPTGADGATSDSVDPSVGFLWSHDVPGPASLFGTVIVSALTDGDDDRFARTGAAVGAGFPIAGELSGFVEYFGLLDAGAGGGPSHNLDGGLLYLVSDDLQLDLNLTLGLNDRASDYAVGAGVGVRF